MGDYVELYLAKYPAIEEARQKIEEEYSLNDIFSEEVLERAVERIVNGVTGNLTGHSETGQESIEIHNNSEIELLSYPAARIIVSIVDDYRITSQYAHAEANTMVRRLKNVSGDIYEEDLDEYSSKSDVYLKELFKEEGLEVRREDFADSLERTYFFEYFNEDPSPEVLQNISDRFNLKKDAEDLERLGPSFLYSRIKSELSSQRMNTENYCYIIRVTDYVSIAHGIHEGKWDLANRGVHDGEVVIAEKEVYEFVKQMLFDKVDRGLPYDVREEVEEELRGKDIIDEVYSGIPEDKFSFEIDEIDEDSFPPLIKHLLTQVREGEHLVHRARFTLASFLVNIGMTTDEIVDTLDINNNFAEEETRYQVNHIRNGRGSDKPYIPPTYDTISSWGIDWKKDELEENVKHPLTYYKIKLQDKEEDED